MTRKRMGTKSMTSRDVIPVKSTFEVGNRTISGTSQYMRRNFRNYRPISVISSALWVKTVTEPEKGKRGVVRVGHAP
jgi:hypothetical protein